MTTTIYFNSVYLSMKFAFGRALLQLGMDVRSSGTYLAENLVSTTKVAQIHAARFVIISTTTTILTLKYLQHYYQLLSCLAFVPPHV